MSPTLTKIIGIVVASIFRAVMLGVLGLGLCLIALTAVQSVSDSAQTPSDLKTRVGISLVISVVAMTSELFNLSGQWWKELGTRLIWAVGCVIASFFVSARVAFRTGALQQVKLPTADRDGEKVLIFGGIWLLCLAIAVSVRCALFYRRRMRYSDTDRDCRDLLKSNA